MAEQSIEIQNAKQTIKLLKDYAGAKTQQKKNVLLNQIRSVNLWIYFSLIKNNEPLDLVSKIEKAISLNKYRPKNMSITQMAINKDLNNIGGEFDTFDSKLEQMVKNKEKPEIIRERFKRGITNISMLAKQFSMDWIHRLNNHKDLVNFARNATSDNMVTAYNELFEALNKDFCDEYKCRIKQRIITDWATSDIKPDYWSDDTLGFHQATGELVLAKKEKENFDKFINNGKKIEEYPGFIRYSHVLVNIANVRKLHSNP
ncbi:MAG: hypothetical protein MJ158_04505, partial [Alphaproteobacteria bacterium]|nr:hypothetical protein [Alphaproteobacteria bacterium]